MTEGIGLAIASCPDCGRTIQLGTRPREGLQFVCSSCGAYLELISLEPLELDWTSSEFEEDWWCDLKEIWPSMEAGC